MRRAVLASLCTALAVCAAHAQEQHAHTHDAPDDGDWRTGAVCYEVFVRSFHDSDGDGIGDLRGLIQKLDYINDGDQTTLSDLGARCIWLMPIAESPSYHGYDVTDYYRVEPAYGTNEDFKRLVAAAHQRGIKVLIDMVLNHASSQHPFFLQALRDPASPYRDWFRWSDTRPEVKGPWGQEVWHRSPMRDEHFYGVFWSGMPDLNYANPAVREEAKKVATFWLREMGADGFRLDAVPFLIEEGDRLAGTPGTHAMLAEYAAHVRSVAPGAYTVGEVWDSTGAMLPYYPGQLDAYFAFEASDGILEAVKSGSAARLLPGYLRLQAEQPAVRWSPFLRNHDMTRTRTFLGGDSARARMAATLLLTLPGVPFIYYGEEIGMTGDKPDERLRTPMQWTGGRSVGFSTGTSWQAAQADSATVNVAAQDRDPGSLLNLHRTLIQLRAGNPALARGELVPLTTSSPQVAAYLRRMEGFVVLVVANLGNSPVSGVTVDSGEDALPLGEYAPVDLLGGNDALPLEIETGGQMRGYVPFRTLAPREIVVLDFTATGC
ncbi:MAG TPA: alpha-amylase family glycosyl hydrolase [Longimicrobiaceae bacterium]|nr:alpha-amylase family glycosyl hydrolase [Longimicrobiaceae bacterium]